ncbi:hypothetical protein PybrP1_010310 [[Pythium] brassicae (nom. inval.)]|nr:hypothetical protein PybrP1_010310 [[Pythium] brassicae (nom. inval.)]
MVPRGFNLDWEWYVAHMSNVATKHDFGIEPRRTSHNPNMTELVKDIYVTIRLVQDVKVMDTHFEVLCDIESSHRSSNLVQLLDYRSHRLLGLTRVIERVLEKWTPLEEWFRARAMSTIGPLPDRQFLFPVTDREIS